MSQDQFVYADVITVNQQANINGPIAGGVVQASVSVATASGTSIPLPASGRVARVSATAVTTSGSTTLAVGTIDGQELTLVNESANNVIISGNMLSAVETVTATAAAKFIWIATDTKWAHIK